MSRFFLTLLVAVAIIFTATVDARQACLRNQRYTDCGSACPPTCSDPNPRICTMQCVPGCFCKSGLVLNSKGLCIPKEACKRMS